MKILFKNLLFLVLICVTNMSYAQGLHYSCDFEMDADTVGWRFVNDSVNQWVINTAINNTASGNRSLYLSSDSLGITHDYDIHHFQ